MSIGTFPVITEKKARKMIDKGGDFVFIHTRTNCPICDAFLPNVMKVVFEKEKYKHIPIYEITETMTFPVGQHPQTYFFKDGRCIQHPAGQTTMENVEVLLDTFYLGEHTIDDWNRQQSNPPPRGGPPGGPGRPEPPRMPPKDITPRHRPVAEIDTDKKIV
jgi:hypothetical protein